MIINAMDIRDRFIKLHSGKIFAREWISPGPDTKTPIILIHDSLGCVDLWREFPVQLCERSGRNVIAYDRLGFGRSTPRMGPLSMNFIDDESEISLPAIFNQLQLTDFIIFGHSVGGAMAVVCAGKFGNRCKAVITESAQSFVEEKTLRAIAYAQLHFQSNNQLERLAKYHGDKTEWVFKAWTETWLASEFASWNLKTALGSVKCPLLVLHGDRDEYGSLSQPEMICKFAAGPSHMANLSDCGHIPHRDKANEVIELVAKFIEALPVVE
jgi:pimeloyl-ACP methyl ester carboxylesterase